METLVVTRLFLAKPAAGIPYSLDRMDVSLLTSCYQACDFFYFFFFLAVLVYLKAAKSSSLPDSFNAFSRVGY